MKIGIIRIDRMGDMILTLPIIQSIKSIDSSIKIHVFASSRNVQVIQSFKYIDRIFNINDENKLNKEKYDLILNISPGWKSFFLCLFSKASKKGNIIFLSRYKKKYYSKLLFLIFSKIFFQKTLIINRIKRFNNNQSIHCTEMMFKLLDKCGVAYEKNLLIENFLPKFKVIDSEKKICLVHLSARWINNYYTETDFLNLILKLQSKFNLALTTDDTTKEKFNLIFKRYPIINNYQFDHFKTLNEVVIFENLNFKNWTQIIHSSNLVITPECGLIHVAAACKIPFKIIYDPNNKPDMMYKEYTPLKSKHERFLFNDKNLNSLLTQNL